MRKGSKEQQQQWSLWSRCRRTSYGRFYARIVCFAEGQTDKLCTLQSMFSCQMLENGSCFPLCKHGSFDCLRQTITRALMNMRETHSNFSSTTNLWYDVDQQFACLTLEMIGSSHWVVLFRNCVLGDATIIFTSWQWTSTPRCLHRKPW